MDNQAEVSRPEELLPPAEASKYLGEIPATTMQWWRTKGRGPRYVKLGRKVYYRRSQLDEFIAAGERVPENA